MSLITYAAIGVDAARECVGQVVEGDGLEDALG